MDINNRNLFISEEIINYLQSTYQNIYSDNEIIKKYVKYKDLLLKKETSENFKSTIEDSTFFTPEDDEELETLNRYFYGNSDGSSSGDGNNLAASYLSTISNIKKMIDEHDGNIKDIVVNLTSLLSDNNIPDETFKRYLNELIIPGISGNNGITSVQSSATLQRDIIKDEYSKAKLKDYKDTKDAELAAEIERKNKIKIKAEQAKQANFEEKKKTLEEEQKLKAVKQAAEEQLRTKNKAKQETENKLVFKEKIAKIDEDIKLKIAKLDIIIKSKLYEKSIYLLSKNKEPRKSKEEATKNADKFTDSYAKKSPVDINTQKTKYEKVLGDINDYLSKSSEIKFSEFDLQKKIDYNIEKLKNIKKILKQLKNDDEEDDVDDVKTTIYDRFKLDGKNNSEEDIKEFNDMIKAIIDKEKNQAKAIEEEKSKFKLEDYEKRLKQAFAIYQNMYNFTKVYFFKFAKPIIEKFIEKLKYLLTKNDKKVGGNKPHESISTLNNIIQNFNVDYDDEDDDYDEYERMVYDSLLAYIRLYTVYINPLKQKILEIKSNTENTDISNELLLLYDEFNKEYNDFIKKHDEMLKNIEKGKQMEIVKEKVKEKEKAEKEKEKEKEAKKEESDEKETDKIKKLLNNLITTIKKKTENEKNMEEKKAQLLELSKINDDENDDEYSELQLLASKNELEKTRITEQIELSEKELKILDEKKRSEELKLNINTELSKEITKQVSQVIENSRGSSIGRGITHSLDKDTLQEIFGKIEEIKKENVKLISDDIEKILNINIDIINANEKLLKLKDDKKKLDATSKQKLAKKKPTTKSNEKEEKEYTMKKELDNIVAENLKLISILFDVEKKLDEEIILEIATIKDKYKNIPPLNKEEAIKAEITKLLEDKIIALKEAKEEAKKPNSKDLIVKQNAAYDKIRAYINAIVAIENDKINSIIDDIIRANAQFQDEDNDKFDKEKFKVELQILKDYLEKSNSKSKSKIETDKFSNELYEIIIEYEEKKLKKALTEKETAENKKMKLENTESKAKLDALNYDIKEKMKAKEGKEKDFNEHNIKIDKDLKTIIDEVDIKIKLFTDYIYAEAAADKATEAFEAARNAAARDAAARDAADRAAAARTAARTAGAAEAEADRALTTISSSYIDSKHNESDDEILYTLNHYRTTKLPYIESIFRLYAKKLLTRFKSFKEYLVELQANITSKTDVEKRDIEDKINDFLKTIYLSKDNYNLSIKLYLYYNEDAHLLNIIGELEKLKKEAAELQTKNNRELVEYKDAYILFIKAELDYEIAKKINDLIVKLYRKGLKFDDTFYQNLVSPIETILSSEKINVSYLKEEIEKLILNSGIPPPPAPRRGGGKNNIDIKRIYELYYSQNPEKLILELLKILRTSENVIYFLLIINTSLTEFFNDYNEMLIKFYENDILLSYYYNEDEIIYYIFLNYIYDNYKSLLKLPKKDIIITIGKIKTKENYGDIYLKIDNLLKNVDIIQKLLIFFKKYLKIPETLRHPEKTKDTEYLLLFIYKYSKNEDNIIKGYDSFLTFIYLNILNKLNNTIKINSTTYNLNNLPTFNLYNFSNLKIPFKIEMSSCQEKKCSKLMKDLSLLIKQLSERYLYIYDIKKISTECNFILNCEIFDYLNIFGGDEIFKNYKTMPIMDLYTLNTHYDLRDLNGLKETKETKNIIYNILLLASYIYKDNDEISMDIYAKLVKHYFITKNNKRLNDLTYQLIFMMSKRINKIDIQRILINELSEFNIDLIEIKKFINPEDRNINIFELLKSINFLNYINDNMELVIPYLYKFYETDNKLQYNIQDLLCKNIIISEKTLMYGGIGTAELTEGMKEGMKEGTSEGMKEGTKDETQIYKTTSDFINEVLPDELINASKKEYEKMQKIIDELDDINIIIEEYKKVIKNNADGKEYGIKFNIDNYDFYMDDRFNKLISEIIEHCSKNYAETKAGESVKYITLFKGEANELTRFKTNRLEKIKVKIGEKKGELLSLYNATFKQIIDKIKNTKEFHNYPNIKDIYNKIIKNNEDKDIIYDDIIKIFDKHIELIDLLIRHIDEIKGRIKDLTDSLDQIIETNKLIKKGGKSKIFRGGEDNIDDLKKQIDNLKTDKLSKMNDVIKSINKLKLNRAIDKNVEKKLATVNFIDKDGYNIFDRLLETYDKDINDKKIPQQITKNLFYNKVKTNNLDPEEELEITLNDKLIFIVLVYCIRFGSLLLCYKLIDSNMITDINKTLFYYFISYCALFALILIIINFDTFKMRILVNYMNLHVNTTNIWMHIILMGSFIYLIYLLIVNILANEKPPTELGEREKMKLKYKLDILTMIIFIFICILIFII